MSLAGGPADSPLPLPLLELVDRLCDQFEAAWPAGGSPDPRPRIEDYLGDVLEPARSRLLAELLALELAYRREAGEAPSQEEYQQRFPRHEAVVRAAFLQEMSLLPDRPSRREESRWYFARNGQKKGPLSWDRLRRFAFSGYLRPTDLVWQKDQARWVPARLVPGLLFPSPSSSASLAPGLPDELDDPPSPPPPSTVDRSGPAVTLSDLGPLPNLPGFEILRRLGMGGMGIVFLARNRRANRYEALKMIRPDCFLGVPPEKQRQLLSRFHTECWTNASVHHDNVVTVYEVGEHGGLPFYSMRYVEGRTLADVIQQGPVPNARAAALMEPVARAVHFLHGKEILHRDLTPRNILVDATDRPFVADFGLAKFREAAQEVTRSGDFLGAPPFMAPEQARDASKATAATDVYGLGATLYALLTGRPPFQAASVVETLDQVKYQEPVPPRRLNPAIAPDLETIVLKCLNKEPARRYRTAEELAEELRRYREGKPILARPAGRGERAWRWCRRNPAAAALGGVSGLAALAVIGVVISLVYYHRLEGALQDAEGAREEARRAQQAEARERFKAEQANYFHRITLAQAGWEEGDLDRTERMLEECPPGRRQWEWYYLKRLCRADLMTLRGDSQNARVLAYRPDGRRFASAGADGVIRVWDARDGRELLSIPAHRGLIDALAYSPDGKFLASGALQCNPGKWKLGEAG